MIISVVFIVHVVRDQEDCGERIDLHLSYHYQMSSVTSCIPHIHHQMSSVTSCIPPIDSTTSSLASHTLCEGVWLARLHY